jgi:ABC-type nitrate/sulfonate/bicarbonate transport system permease component
MVRSRSSLYSLAATAGFLLIWHVATLNTDPSLFPPPGDVAIAFIELIETGVLIDAVGISLQRVVLGWLLGAAIAIPIGILAGTSVIARALFDPFIHFFRFVPALALISLFILWFGIGEASKVNLVAFAAAFIIIVNTATGAASVPEDKINAARCMGASRSAVLRSVVIPATVPYIFTGMRLALASAFLVIVAAEALATQSGIGYMIWNARTFFRTDQIFVGIAMFGVLGFLGDRLWKLIGATVLRRYLRGAGAY